MTSIGSDYIIHNNLLTVGNLYYAKLIDLEMCDSSSSYPQCLINAYYSFMGLLDVTLDFKSKMDPAVRDLEAVVVLLNLYEIRGHNGDDSIVLCYYVLYKSKLACMFQYFDYADSLHSKPFLLRSHKT